MGRYFHVRAGGITFAFAWDPAAPGEVLHIYARHLTTVDEALATWFDDAATDTWNDEHQRFETENDTHVLYWSWLTEYERVLIITCFRKED
jgi:hypothetical protein